MNYLIYTLHIKEMDMNKKFNVSLICELQEKKLRTKYYTYFCENLKNMN